MELRNLGMTDLAIAPLVFGGNVLGWTADRQTSFTILDAFFEAGFNAIDTADYYPRFIPGLEGGISERMLGDWMRDRGVRDQVVVITKGGLEMGEGMKGLNRHYLPRACEASLERLQTDYIDVYMAHRADPTVPIEETLGVFQGLIDAGKIRHAGASNYTPKELSAALDAAGDGKARFSVLEPHYNLVTRDVFEGALENLCVTNRLGVVPYYALAAGFLTGKYRSKDDLRDSARGNTVARFLNRRGMKLLDALDKVAERHSATPAQVALAWIMARPSVTAPIASATSVKQLREILHSADLALTCTDLAELDV